MFRAVLQRDDAAALGQCTRDPDGAVTAQRTDLKHAARLGHQDQQVKKLSLEARYVNSRQAGFATGLARGLVLFFMRSEKIAEVVVDFRPQSLGGFFFESHLFIPRHHKIWDPKQGALEV